MKAPPTKKNLRNAMCCARCIFFIDPDIWTRRGTCAQDTDNFDIVSAWQLCNFYKLRDGE